MSINWIRIRTSTKAKRKDQQPITQDDAVSIAQQIGADAVYGSFSGFRSNYWKSRWERPVDEFVRAVGSLDDQATGAITIELYLNADLYPTSQGGIQHLIGV